MKMQNSYRVARSSIVIGVVLACLCTATTTSASDQIPGAPQQRPIALVGGTVHTVANGTMDNATVVFDKGKIVAVGRAVRLPPGCQVIKVTSKHVYPGLIEPYSDIGLVEINSVRGTIDSAETGRLNAAVRAAVAFNPDSELIPVNRANGILLAVTAPRGPLIAGRSALMMMDGWTWEDMTLKADVGMHINWNRVNDSQIEELQRIFDQARRYADSRKRRPERPRDLNLEALQPVLRGQIPVIASARTYKDITSAIAFAVNNGLKLIILGGYDAPMCVDQLKEHHIPVIISGVYRLPERRHEPYDAGYALPAQLHAAGVPFCISAAGRFGASAIRNLPYNAAAAVGFGLPEDAALRSITLSAAEILGVDDRVGSLEPGKDATLFVADGNILETPTQVERAYIQGRRVDLSSKHTQLYEKYLTKYRRLNDGR